MATQSQLRQAFDALHREGTILAGGLGELSQRATVYRQIFRDSGRNHIFPLIAAHGALWARGYFQFGFKIAAALVWQYFASPAKRRQQFAALATFADAFRDINRRVCIDTYTNFHFTARHGAEDGAVAFVSGDLLAALRELHATRHSGGALDPHQQQTLFSAHFLNEQQHVVGPCIAAAVAAFDWPLLKWIALRPIIHFAFFPYHTQLWFQDFSDREQRIVNGLKAFQIGQQVGWDEVEDALRNYRLLPTRFFTQPEMNFAEMRRGLLAGA